jgi:hypothetical protein
MTGWALGADKVSTTGTVALGEALPSDTLAPATETVGGAAVTVMVTVASLTSGPPCPRGSKLSAPV